MRKGIQLRIAVAVFALSAAAGTMGGRTNAQIDCADQCVASFAACVNGDLGDCQNKLDLCLENCLRGALLP